MDLASTPSWWKFQFALMRVNSAGGALPFIQLLERVVSIRADASELRGDAMVGDTLRPMLFQFALMRVNSAGLRRGETRSG